MGYIKYYLYKKQYSTDNGQTWYDVTPLETTPSGDPIGNYSTLEECERQPPQYRTTSGTPYCQGNDKYIDIYSQVSYDGGNTWSTTATTTTLVERNSEDCRYIPPTPFDGKIRLSYTNGDEYTAVCDSNTTITSGETHPTGYTYSAMTSAEIGDCVTSISSSTFIRCSGLTSVIIGSGVTSIGNYAFQSCTGLTSVNIPSGVTNFERQIFNACWSLSRLNSNTDGVFNIPNSVTSIGPYALCNCRSAKYVYVPNSVITIGEGAFQYCRSLTGITLGNSITTIKTYAFQYCTGLTSVSIPDSVTSISGSAFSSCSGLTSCIIGSGVTNIGDYAFSNCSKLTSIDIPDNVTSIGEKAFNGCSGLTSVTIGSGVTTIGTNAFYNCTSLPVVGGVRYADTYALVAVDKTLRTYILRNGTKWIGDCAFSGCTALASLTIPDSVTSIGSGMCSGCTSLTSCTMSSGITTIGNRAFENCRGLTSLTIGSNITRIGECAYLDCRGLTSITIEATTPPSLGIYGFDNTNNAPIYVPAGSVKSYKKASGVWGSYSSRIQAIPTS